jgi:lipid-A-disaccharide synthase
MTTECSCTELKRACRPGESLVTRNTSIMIVVGEPSGDELGAQLIAALNKLGGGCISITGVGGQSMMALGMRPLFTIDATSVMGLREVIPRIPAILRRVREASDFALKTHPDALVIIDSPDFTHRIAQRVKCLDPSIAIINYAPPQVWASRSYRARKMARYIDAVINFFPFEMNFFQRFGIPAYCAGYPVIERASLIRGGAALRAARGIAQGAPVLAVLPGSRRNEIRFILPPFQRAVEILVDQIPELVCVIPTVSHVADLVRAAAEKWPTPVHVVESNADRFAAFDAADAALAASGTVTSELALARTPMVVGYRLGWLTYALARPFVYVPYIALINLVLNRQAVPELIQGACTPEALVTAVKPLLHDSDARAVQLRDLDTAVQAFGAGDEAPSIRAARIILKIAKKEENQ